MWRSLTLPGLGAIGVLVGLWLGAAEPLAAQSQWPPYPQMGSDPHAIDRGPGGYLAGYKLLLIALIFLVWVRWVDWINRDAIRFSKFTELPPRVWNPLLLSTFLVGFVGVLSIPLFLVGFAAFAMCAAVPVATYLVMRRGKIPEEELTGSLGLDESVGRISVPISFDAAGETAEQAQSNLIRAKQSPVFEEGCQMIHDAVIRRGDQLLMDFTRDAVQTRIQVDGQWHALPTLDRQVGDPILESLKLLANLNPSERRTQQKGRFEAKVAKEKVTFDLLTQGVPSGERALMRIIREETLKMDLAELGMWPDMIEPLKRVLNDGGYTIISAPPGQGLSTSWQAVLNASDRFVRDWVGVVDWDDRETQRENIEVVRFDSRAGESPVKRLASLMLKQPNALVVPNPVNAESLDRLCREVVQSQRTVVSRIQAKSATEALLRLMSLSEDRSTFVAAAAAVTCQRLVRRLCDQCKQPLQLKPEAIVKMGGDPKESSLIYQPFQPPPPEQQVDAHGKPIEIVPCQACSGFGYLGQIAIFQLLLIDGPIRQALLKTPRLEDLNAIARKQGSLSLLEQGYRMVLAGITSLAEVQRVTQSP